MSFIRAFILLLCLSAVSSQAQINQPKPVETSQTFGEYTVHFSVFNSTFISPEVAKIYGLTRASNQSLVNISLTRTSDGKTSLGLPAEVSGTATNLIQQQRTLKFQTVSEGDATYYLAPVRHTNEEVINFIVQVKAESASAPLTVRFTRTLHEEQ